jgi:hypothetical protein
MLFTMLLFALASNASTIREVKVYVDGKEVSFPDQKPYIDANNRTLVPVRFPAEVFGAKVDWDGKDGKGRVDIAKPANNKNVQLWINQRNYLVNGSSRSMDTEAVLTPQGRTVVPVRFIAEALGVKVEWDVTATGIGVVHNFTLGQSDAEIKKIIEQIRNQIEGDQQTQQPANKVETYGYYEMPKMEGTHAQYSNIEGSRQVIFQIDLRVISLSDLPKINAELYKLIEPVFGPQVAREFADYFTSKTHGTQILHPKILRQPGKTIGVNSGRTSIIDFTILQW